MTLAATGEISMSQIQLEHGGNGEISLGEYYRGGGVGDDPWNATVPTSAAISMGSLRGTTATRVLIVTVQGGGGAGGQGEADNWVSDGHGGPGGATTVSCANGTWADTSVSAAGGAGGAGVVISYSTTAGRAGEASFYGAGGAGGGNNAHGSSAPATSYGAGGGGGGGDSPSTYDNSGYGGHGGYVGGRILQAPLRAMRGSVVTVTIGAGGPYNNNIATYGNNYYGGAGAAGVAWVGAQVYLANSTFTVT